MKIKDLIKYLETLPPQTDVKVVVMHDCGYSGYIGEFEDLIIDKNTELTDMRKNQFAKGKPYENEVTLYLGDK